ncbi:MAG: ATP-binding protein [Parachlamydiales bacterium]|nr:ATP-binding protein [Parachlamydiales bacterium]
MIKRNIEAKLIEVSKKFPVVALLGPRQTGKTTTSRCVFNSHNYVSLENLDQREFAISDPKGFLKTNHNGHGMIIDEIQYAPDLLSYIQTQVDESQKPGEFILTGSQNFLIHEKISQTLAGRIFVATLLPFSIDELKSSKLFSNDINKSIFFGFYPRIIAQNINPVDWYPNYIRTYIERDIRLIKNITDLHLFQKFIKLCAGRIGQLLNFSSLANDCGISINTVKSWISVLEQSYIIFLLYPHFNNFSKRIIKMPKLYFFDTALACSLLELEKESQVMNHYLKGNLFESLIISDLLKQRYNKGLTSNLSFYRDRIGHEIDCIFHKGNELIPIEIKISQTFNTEYLTEIRYWQKIMKSTQKGLVVYGGEDNQIRQIANVLSWHEINSIVANF